MYNINLILICFWPWCSLYTLDISNWKSTLKDIICMCTFLQAPCILGIVCYYCGSYGCIFVGALCHFCCHSYRFEVYDAHAGSKAILIWYLITDNIPQLNIRAVELINTKNTKYQNTSKYYNTTKHKIPINTNNTQIRKY